MQDADENNVREFVIRNGITFAPNGHGDIVAKHLPEHLQDELVAQLASEGINASVKDIASGDLTHPGVVIPATEASKLANLGISVIDPAAAATRADTFRPTGSHVEAATAAPQSGGWSRGKGKNGGDAAW